MAIYAVVDPVGKRVIDLVFVVQDKSQMEELVEVYREVTGSKLAKFPTVAEGRRKVTEALFRLYFVQPEEVKTDAVKPAPVPREKDGPVAKCRQIYAAMKGHPRKDVISACIAAGVNKATASTQYQILHKRDKQPTPSEGAQQIH